MTEAPVDPAVLAAELGTALARASLSLVTAESCTGGGVAWWVTSVPGSSHWFERGFVTYSNVAKQEQLGVDPEILARHGAVSEQTASAMAHGALAASGADLAVAVTGIAGPGGGTPEKPVGTVCFAWLRRGAAPRTARRHFPGDRAAVRHAAVAAALQGALAALA